MDEDNSLQFNEPEDISYLPEEVLNTHINKGATEILIKWEGRQMEESTWENLEDVNCEILLAISASVLELVEP